MKSKKSFKKAIKSFLKVWSLSVLIFVLVIYSWFAIHETSHALMCKINGGSPSIAQILPHPMVHCEGIVSDGKLLITPISYFFYAIIPYIVGLGLLIAMKLSKKSNVVLFMLLCILLLDAAYNYILSPFRRTDFTQTAIVSPKLFIVSLVIVLAEWLIGYSMYKRQWKSFRVYTKKLMD